MHFYPEVQPTAVGEVWEAGRWMEYEDELLAPMWISDRLDQYYIHEVAQLLDGRFVIPLRWVTIHGIVHARSAEVINQVYSFVSNKRQLTNLSSCRVILGRWHAMENGVISLLSC